MSVAADQPIAEMNITPLIDVLLVLLIMMILTLPVTTHRVPLDLPRGAPARDPGVAHRLVLLPGGGVLLDGAALVDAALPARLAAVRASGRPLVIAADGAARYGRVDAVLATVPRAGITRLGFEGNDRFATAF